MNDTMLSKEWLKRSKFTTPIKLKGFYFGIKLKLNLSFEIDKGLDDIDLFLRRYNQVNLE